jgi:hypothetical protein
MSILDYTVIYHRNGQTSIHGLSSWEQILAEFEDETDRIVKIPNPFGGIAVMKRQDMESIYLVTEEEADWSSQRHAAFGKLDRDNQKEWE